MTREPIIQQNTDDGSSSDEGDRDLRPQRMEDMVGQREVYARIRIAVDAARKRNEPLGHILFDGPPGLGKTTFAMCIPREMGVNVQLTSGAALSAPKDLVPYLTNADDGSILFIDEIHRLSVAIEEYLYTAMEDFRIDIVHGEGTNARTMNLWLKPFTLIGATTRSGTLSAPLRDRFQLREHLEFYSVDELSKILQINATKLGVEMPLEAANLIASRSRGTPRVANNHLRWVRDYATSKADGKITSELAIAALTMAGVDNLGLDQQDRKYLETIIRVFGGGPAGVEAIAHTINAPVDTLSDEVEPFLLRTELVVRTPRGRVATTRTYQHLNVALPQEGNGIGPQGKLF